jgi:hypothetical protein
MGVRQVNDEPNITLTTLSPTFSGSAVNVFSNASVFMGGSESNQNLIQFKMTAFGLKDGANERLTIDGTTITLTPGTSGTTTNGWTYDLISTSAENVFLTVSHPEGKNVDTMNTLFNSITYTNTAATKTTGTRSIRLDRIQDDGGTEYGGVDSKGSLSLTSTVNVPVAPIVLDLNRDGELNYANVLMDINSDGVMDNTLWADMQDGVLVWDKYRDGQVHDMSQYAFTEYGGSTDLEGLAAGFDTNRDGVFSMADEKFGEFKIWQDVNQNGVSDAGEVLSLADWGITSINLLSDGVQRTPVDGVLEAGRSAANLADGGSMLVADAAFAFRDATADELAAHAVKTTASSDEWQNKPYELSDEELAAIGLTSEATASAAIQIDTQVNDSSVYLLSQGMSLDLSQVINAMSADGATPTALTQIDMATDSSTNVLSLSLADVLSLPAANGVHQLILTGASNDKLVLAEGEWADTGVVMSQNGHQYAVYNASNDATAQLLIDQQMVNNLQHN